MQRLARSRNFTSDLRPSRLDDAIGSRFGFLSRSRFFASSALTLFRTFVRISRIEIDVVKRLIQEDSWTMSTR